MTKSCADGATLSKKGAEAITQNEQRLVWRKKQDLVGGCMHDHDIPAIQLLATECHSPAVGELAMVTRVTETAPARADDRCEGDFVCNLG